LPAETFITFIYKELFTLVFKNYQNFTIKSLHIHVYLILHILSANSRVLSISFPLSYIWWHKPNQQHISHSLLHQILNI